MYLHAGCLHLEDELRINEGISNELAAVLLI